MAPKTNKKMPDGGNIKRRRNNKEDVANKIQSTPNGYVLPELEVTAQKPAFLKYEDRFEKQFPKTTRIRQYLDQFARSLGNSENNYPERIDRDYNQDKTDYTARALILDRNTNEYTPREQRIINQSKYWGKSKEDVYRNPQKLPISGGDAALNTLYQNDFLTQIPGVRQAIQRLARNQISGSTITKGFKEPGFDEVEDPNKTEYAQASFDPLAQFLGSDQGIEKSRYVPKNDYLSFLPSYSLKNKLGVNPKFKELSSRFVGNSDLKNNPIFDQGLGYTPYAEQPDLGHYKSGAAWDAERNLPYYFVSDAWDFDPQDYATRYQTGEKGQQPQTAYKQAYLLQKAGNPYKIYDRFYFDPQTGEYIDDTKDSRFKKTTMKNGGSLNFSSEPAYKRWLGYVHARGLAESTPGNQEISINKRQHKVKHAYGGALDSNIYGNNPYSVASNLQNNTPFIPYSPNGSPLNQSMANINNYFATEPSNMIPNEASLEGPSFSDPEYLLNADTNQVSQSNYKPIGTGTSKGSAGKQFKMPNIRFNTAAPILALAGLTGQLSQQQDQIDAQSRKAKRQMNQEVYNPFPYGTGSTAIFGNGGKLKGKKMEEGGWLTGGFDFNNLLRERALRKLEDPDYIDVFDADVQFDLLTNKYITTHKAKKGKKTIYLREIGDSAFNFGKMGNGGYMIGQTYNLTQDELAALQESGYSFDIIS